MCCNLKVLRLFSSLSREMLTFSRLIQHNTARETVVLKEMKELPGIVVVSNEYHYKCSRTSYTVCDIRKRVLS